MTITPPEAATARALALAQYNAGDCAHPVALARWLAVEDAIRGLEKNDE